MKRKIKRILEQLVAGVMTFFVVTLLARLGFFDMAFNFMGAFAAAWLPWVGNRPDLVK
jgi:hypothetical protein